jgi:transcriptional regulator with XRE-family HTH domain
MSGTMKINTQRIKYELSRKGWSQNRLASELGVTRQGLHYMLTTKPTVTRVERIAEVLGVNFMDLIIIITSDTKKAA